MTDGNRILIIPISPISSVNKSRPLQIARYLQGDCGLDVQVLAWRDEPPPGSRLHRLMGRGGQVVRQLAACRSVSVREGIKCVSMPLLMSSRLGAARFNARQLARWVREERIDWVLSEHMLHFPMPAGGPDAPQMIYDVADDFISPHTSIFWRRTRGFALRELHKAHYRLVISRGLQQVLEAEGFPDALYVPNGVDYHTYQTVTPAAVEACRKKYELGDSHVVSLIGNHGHWVALQFVAQVFKRLVRACPRIRLLIVGDVADQDALRALRALPQARVAGPVPVNEIAAVYACSDVGLLPFHQGPFTDNALPLKVLEYGAAHKRVLSSPLRELEILGLPHVELKPMEVESWVHALQNACEKGAAWDSAWDHRIREYDWSVVLKPLQKILARPMT